MSNEVFQLVQAYQNISTGNNELINLATQEISALLSNPSIINSLLQIIDESDVDYIRKQATISLKLAISTFKDNFSVEEVQNLLYLILRYLSNEKFENIQSIIFDIIYILISDDTFQILSSFIQECTSDSLVARLALTFSDDDIEQIFPFLEPIIIRLLDSDVNGILLGFRTRQFIDPEFFLQIFQKGIDISIQLSNNTTSLAMLIKSILESIEYIEDKSFILDLYLPLIGSDDLDIPPQNQLLYASVVTEVIHSIEMNDIQTMFLILQNFYNLYALIDKDHDIFSFIESFASNSDFLALFISKLPEYESSEKTLGASILSLSHCFSACMNVNTNFIYVDEVSNYLAKAVLHPSKSIRTSTGATISVFSEELEENISSICPLLVDSMIDSLDLEDNDDIIEGLSAIFIHSCNDEESVKIFFDKCFSFFLTKLQNCENMQHYYPSFVALCATSRVKSHEYFDQIFEINNTILNSTDQEVAYLQNFAVDGLKNLAILSSDEFSDKISELINYFIQILEQNNDDNELVMSILSAIGAFISKFSMEVDFTTLIPFLSKIVESNYEPSSIALSIICVIMDEFTDKVDLSQTIPDILQYFELLSNEILENIEEYLDKPILNLLRAMTHFVDYIDKISKSGNVLNKDFNEQNKAKSISDLYDFVFNWTVSIMNGTNDNYILSEAISVLIEITDDYDFDTSVLFPLFERIFAKEYDDDLFPTFIYFIKLLIKKGFSFDSIIPDLFEMANSSSQKKIRDFGLQILGQIAESHRGECIDENFIKNLVEVSLKNINEFESSSAVFVINQMVTGLSTFPNFVDYFNPTQIMGILLEFIQMDKKNSSYLSFADNCITSFASIVIHIVKDAVPFDSYLQIVLERMPARFDTCENFEMMHFLLWIGNQTDFNPSELFLAVFVRFFSNPIESDVVGFIADYDDTIATLKAKMLLLMKRVENLESFVSQVCNDDEYKLHCFQKNISNENEEEEDENDDDD